MNFGNLIGSVAGILTTIAFVPQVIKTWRAKSTRDVSLITFMLFTTGILLWIIYGFYIASLPVIFANIITFFLAVIILIFKVRYG